MHAWHIRNRTLEIGTRALVMGIVNVTPDSFSDGGKFSQTDAAIAHALALVEQGADILDIGGESTRPGAEPVAVDEELRRVLPVVEELVGLVQVPLSVDTSKAAVARACLEAGAHIINDVTALTGDPEMTQVARAFGAGVVLMHMQGTPATMQIAPYYDDVVRDILRYLTKRVEAVVAQGLERDNLVIDPGLSFGMKFAHNLEVLARLEEFQSLGLPVCLGASRKGFIAKIVDRPIDQRVAGSLAVAAFALAKKAVQVLRVHDVAQTGDLVRVWQTLQDFSK